MTWDKTYPADTVDFDAVDNAIRELKTDIGTALTAGETSGVEAVFPGTDTSAPVYEYRGLTGNEASRPSAGSHGFYYNTTQCVLQRDNGATWQDIATMIPAGTKCLFYQVSSPIGWTLDDTHTDKALRVVSGVPADGGTHGISDPPITTHGHTIADHVLTILELPSHTHRTSNYTAFYRVTGGGSQTERNVQYPQAMETGLSGGGQAHGHVVSDSTSDDAFCPKYVDVICCSKD